MGATIGECANTCKGTWIKDAGVECDDPDSDTLGGCGDTSSVRTITTISTPCFLDLSPFLHAVDRLAWSPFLSAVLELLLVM